MTKELLSVEEFKIIGSDDRGITAEFKLPRKQEDFIYITRKAGSVSGNTYHAGKSEATNPKMFILFSGKIKISWRKVDEKKSYQQEVQAPALIKIAPYVTHKVETLEDMIIVECNSIEDIQGDRFKEDV